MLISLTIVIINHTLQRHISPIQALCTYTLQDYTNTNTSRICPENRNVTIQLWPNKTHKKRLWASKLIAFIMCPVESLFHHCITFFFHFVIAFLCFRVVHTIIISNRSNSIFIFCQTIPKDNNIINLNTCIMRLTK